MKTLIWGILTFAFLAAAVIVTFAGSGWGLLLGAAGVVCYLIQQEYRSYYHN